MKKNLRRMVFSKEGEEKMNEEPKRTLEELEAISDDIYNQLADEIGSSNLDLIDDLLNVERAILKSKITRFIKLSR